MRDVGAVLPRASSRDPRRTRRGARAWTCTRSAIGRLRAVSLSLPTWAMTARVRPSSAARRSGRIGPWAANGRRPRSAGPRSPTTHSPLSPRPKATPRRRGSRAPPRAMGDRARLRRGEDGHARSPRGDPQQDGQRRVGGALGYRAGVQPRAPRDGAQREEADASGSRIGFVTSHPRRMGVGGWVERARGHPEKPPYLREEAKRFVLPPRR